MQYLGVILKWQNGFGFQGKSFNITVIQVYTPTPTAKEAEVEWFCEDQQDFIEQHQKSLFYHRGLECKVGSQEILRI